MPMYSYTEKGVDLWYRYETYVTGPYHRFYPWALAHLYGIGSLLLQRQLVARPDDLRFRLLMHRRPEVFTTWLHEQLKPNAVHAWRVQPVVDKYLHDAAGDFCINEAEYDAKWAAMARKANETYALLRVIYIEATIAIAYESGKSQEHPVGDMTDFHHLHDWS